MSDVPGAAGGDTVGLPTNIAPSDADIAKGIEGLLDAEAPRRRRAQPAAEPREDTPSDAVEASDPGTDPLPTRKRTRHPATTKTTRELTRTSPRRSPLRQSIHPRVGRRTRKQRGLNFPQTCKQSLPDGKVSAIALS